MLLGGHEVSVRRITLAGFDGALGDVDEIADVLVVMQRRFFERRARRHQFHVHDVAHRPRAARPRVGVIGRRHQRVGQAARRRTQLLALDLHRRSDVDRRGFGQNADGIVIVRRGAQAAVPPCVISRIRDDAFEARGLKVQRHLRAERADLAQDGRVNVRVRRVEERRHAHARAELPLLMDVVDDFGEPLAPKERRDNLRLDLRQHEPVAVVVVAGVVMIEHRRAAAFVLRAERLAIPVGDDVYAVGVDRRHKHQHRLAEHLSGRRRVVARQTIGQLHRHLRGDDFGRVNRAGDGDDRRRRANQTLALFAVGEQARIGQSSLRLADARQILDVFFRRDDGDDERSALGRQPRLMHRDARRRRIKALEVSDDLRPVGQMPVVARREAKHLARRWHGGGPRGLCSRGYTRRFQVGSLPGRRCRRRRAEQQRNQQQHEKVRGARHHRR